MALFIACTAAVVSFAETASIVWPNSGPSALLERLRLRVGLVRARRHLRLAGEHRQDRPGVLGVAVDLAARQRLVGDLARADVPLQRDLVALGLERLLIQRPEQVLLREV